jgi:hypothetical protein
MQHSNDYKPEHVSLFGNEPPVGQPKMQYSNDYKPENVSFFGKDVKPDGPPGNRGREGYDPSKVSW